MGHDTNSFFIPSIAAPAGGGWREELEKVPLLGSINLQMFAAEDEGKTEKPTPRRLREARKKGRVAKTPELAPALVLVFGSIFLFFTASKMFADLKVLVQKVFQMSSSYFVDVGNLQTLVNLVALEMIRIMAPLVILVFVVSAAGELVQVGFNFSTEPLKPKFEKISFTWEKLRTKILFSRPMMMNLVKSFLKLAIISVISYAVITGSYGKLVMLVDADLEKSLAFVAMTAFRLIIWVAILFLALSIFDYFYQRFEFTESQKMTKQEVKREMIEEEGNPLYKARRMELYRQLMAQKKMLAEVPKADVVITNPTHYAVALQYDAQRMQAPTCIAKGEDAFALEIKRIALAHGVEVRENRELARKLFDSVEVGTEVPENLWSAVAIILSEVLRLKRQRVTSA
jgi:flagellar biosynthetic protein FlhB